MAELLAAPCNDACTIESLSQDCSVALADTVRVTNTFPVGAARDLYSTYTSFNAVLEHLSENLLAMANSIFVSQGMPGTFKKGEDCISIIEELNNTILDRANKSKDLQQNIASGGSGHSIGCIQVREPKVLQVSSMSNQRPQKTFSIQVNNSLDVWRPLIKFKPNSKNPQSIEEPILDKHGVITSYRNPYEKEIRAFKILKAWTTPNLAIQPKALPTTQFEYIETEEELSRLAEHLEHVDAIAIDVEHNSYRSFQGMTCLIQVSTETGGDFIIDVLKLWTKLQCLNTSFTNPAIKKVMHGSINDIIWLQRDCGLYIVGLFDTFIASKALGYRKNKLSDLVSHFCNVELDKTNQCADWRLRPLPEDLVRYARLDTHYLLYVAERLTLELSSRKCLFERVFDLGRDVSSTAYVKQVLKESDHLNLCSTKRFSLPQKMAVKHLYQWRDRRAREEDESVHYILSDKSILKLVEDLPSTSKGALACVQVSPIATKDIHVILDIIRECRTKLNAAPVKPEAQNVQVPESCNRQPDDNLQGVIDLNPPFDSKVENAGETVEAAAYPIPHSRDKSKSKKE